MDATERVEIPPEQEGEIRKDAKLRERRRLAGRTKVVTEVMEPCHWEYITLRVGGMSSQSAVIKVAEDRGERLERKAAENRAAEWERKCRGQIEAHRTDRYQSDADFEVYVRLKVEQIAASPGPHAQSALRALMMLKKMREDHKARNPEALKQQLMESAKQLERLDSVEEEARRRGLL